MQTKKLYLIIIVFILGLTEVSFAQRDTRFWFAAPNVTSGHDGGRLEFNIRFATFDLPAEITVSIPTNPGYPPEVINLPANAAATVNIDETTFYDEMRNFPVNTVNNRGVLIESTNDITAYFEISTPNNPDIYSLKGDNALGTEFYVPFQNFWRNGVYNPRPYSSIDIVATEDNTQVTVTPTRPIHPGIPAGTPLTFMLNRGQTFAVVPENYPNTGRLPENHLGGTKVESNRPIAIITSDDSVDAHPEAGCKDVVGDQIIPTDIIGREYIAMRGRLTITEHFYVFGTEDGTDVFVDDGFIQTIDEGEIFRYEFTESTHHIRTTEPSYVFHVAGFGCEMGGAILPPIDRCTGSTEVSFTRSKGDRFFLNILVRAGAEGNFELNGDPTLVTAADFNPVVGNDDWLAAEFEFNAATIPVGAASRIINTEDVFHLGIINGGATNGVLYGYFSDFNEMEVDATIGGSDSYMLLGCSGSDFLIIGEGGTHYEWTPPDYLDNPFSRTPIATPPHSMQYKLVASGACDLVDSAFVSVNLIPPVVSLFDVSNVTGCSPLEVQIDNYSIGVVNYSWRYGDGATSTYSGQTLTHTYTNDTDEPIVYDLELVGRNLFCRDTLRTSITVFPEIEAEILNSDTSACAPITIDFEVDSDGADFYYWDFGDGSTSTQREPTHTFHNYSESDTIFTVILEASSEYGCISTDTIEVHLNPYIEVGFDFDPPEHCNPYEIEIVNTSYGATTNIWNFDDGTGDTEINDDTITYFYENPGSEPDTFNISLYVFNDYGCSDTLTRQVVVFPYLEAAFTPSETEGCNPLTVNFENNSEGAESYHWTFDKEEGSSSEESPEHTFFNPSPTEEAVFNVVLVTTSEYGCKDTASVEITVYPRLEAAFTFEKSSYCSPYDVVIYNNAVGAETVHWDFGDGNDYYESADEFIHTFENPAGTPATYTITQTVENEQGCQEVKTRDIIIYPNIEADFEIDFEEGCHPLEVVFTNLSSGADEYLWDFGDGNTSSQESFTRIFYNESHTDIKEYNITLYVESEYGCIDSIGKQITVFPKPKAANYLPVTEGCSPLDVEFVDQSIGGETYQWIFGDGNEETRGPGDFNHIYNNPGNESDTLYPSLIISNEYGCSDTTTKEVVVFPDIDADFDITGDGCHPLEVTIYNNSTGASGSVPYKWDYGDGNTSTNQEDEHTRIFNNTDHYNSAIYTIELIVESYYGCKDTHTEDIIVYPRPVAKYEVDEHTGCSPHTVEFTDESAGDNLSYFWTFGDGETSAQEGDVVHTYNQPHDAGIGVFLSELEVTNEHGCSDQHQKNINVYPNNDALILNGDISGCAPFTVNFENGTEGASSYHWDFGNGSSSTEFEPTHTFHNYNSEDTTFTVVLRTTSDFGCIDYDTIEVNVMPYVKSIFDFEPKEHCNPYHIEIINTSKGATSNVWDFGDGTAETENNADTVYHIFNNPTAEPDTFNIRLFTFNDYGCSDTLEREVIVFPYLEADFTPIPSEGCNPLTVDFDNNSIGAETYYWRFDHDEGSSSQENPQHVFHNPSSTDEATFNVKLVATSEFGCKDTIYKEITVYTKLEPGFTFEQGSYCSPYEVTIYNDVVGAETVHWDFGDGNSYYESADEFTHTFNNTTGSAVTYTITQTVENERGCQEVMTRDITIHPNIDAGFTMDVEQGCHPLEISFTNTSAGAETYHWNFGDGNTSSQENPTRIFYNDSHTDIITYEITLYTESEYGCSDSITREITVFPKPKSAKYLPVTEGCSPLDIEFTDQSIGGETYQWIFGDGNEETESPGDMNHTYHNPGNESDTLYPSLIVINEYGCRDTTTKEVVVYPDIDADFDITTEGCHPLEATIYNNSTGASGEEPYKWDYGDGNTSNNENDEHTHVFRNTDNYNSEVYTIELIAKSRYGCLDIHTEEITVLPTPVAKYDVDENKGCSPHDVEFIDDSAGDNLSYLWTFGDGETSNESGGASHTYHQPHDGGIGKFMSELEITNEHGCTSTYQKEITVYPDIEANFTGNKEGCHPLTVNFEDLSLGADDYHWDFGDGSYSNAEEPVNTYYNNSHTDTRIFDVELRVKSQYGCKDSITKQVEVYPKPKVDFSVDITDGCSPLSVSFENNSVGVDNYEWDFEDSTSQTSQANFNHVFRNTGDSPRIFTVILTGYNDEGCYSELTKEITVYPEVTADFTTEQGYFDGCTPLELDFLNQSELADYYKWDFGEGTTSSKENPGHIFYNDENDVVTYDVVLIATSQYGCSDTRERVVSVYPQPIADFEATPREQVYPSREVILINNTTPDGDWTYHWDFGDGNEYITTDDGLITHTYEEWEPGNYATRHYDITLTVYNDYCSDKIEERITILAPEPRVGFSPSTQGCPPLEVQFYDEVAYGYFFHWDFDDGNYSNEENPTHVFENPGIYEVVLTVTGEEGAVDSAMQTVTVFEPPTAKFIPDPKTAVLPDAYVQMINLSSLGETYTWEFGDGNMSWDYQPTHLYRRPGTYYVTLEVGGDTDPQCFDETMDTVVIIKAPCAIRFPNAFTPNEEGPSGGHYNPGDPANEVFYPVHKGIDDYELLIYNRWGELIFRSTDINIGWDGYHRGELVKMDVYVWKVKARCINGEEIIKAGDVTVVR